ncbi:hypothetical protein SERLA73DRAFT_43681, partial [Serpula lacrymans var. lacrymans S7.3]
LSVQRLRIIEQKKEAQAKSSRRDIAMLLEKGKIESARVKVEAIIHEDIHVELLELLELYCELLLARFGLLDQNSREPDPGISEGVCSIIHAAPRTDLKELQVLRELLMHKYGREFSAAVMENRNGCVSDRVLKKLTIATPSGELVDGYLGEIARGYHVDWAPAPPPLRAVDDADADAVPRLPNLPPTEDEGEDEKGAIEEKEKLKPKPKPKDASANVYSSAYSPPPPMVQEPEDEDDFSALARRFEALKRR